MRKPCKVIKAGGGEINIFGNHHWIEIQYDIPPWTEYNELEACFTYLGHKYFLSEFMPVYKSGNFTDFDAYESGSFFSGILIKYHDDEDAIKAYTYIM